MPDLVTDKARWKNRRFMAYVALWSILAMVVWILGLSTFAVIAGKTLVSVEQVGGILSTIIVCLASIIGAYVGFSAWDDKNILAAQGKQKTVQAKEEA